MANRDRSGDAESWPYRFDERDGSVDRYAGGTRGNARDDYRGSGAYGGSYTAGGRAGAGFGGGYYGYPRGRADRDEERVDAADEPRRGFVAGWGGNVAGYGRGGALDYGYGGMNVGGRDRDWGLGDVPHLPDERYGGRWDSERGDGMYGRAWGRPSDTDRRDRVQPDHTGRGPRGYRRSDVRINEDVCDALTANPELDAGGIEVRVESGEVTLSGIVPDRYSKRLAEDLTDTVAGVRDVQNRLRVQQPAPDRGMHAGEHASDDLTETGDDLDVAPTAGPRRKRR